MRDNEVEMHGFRRTEDKAGCEDEGRRVMMEGI